MLASYPSFSACGSRLGIGGLASGGNLSLSYHLPAVGDQGGCLFTGRGAGFHVEVTCGLEDVMQHLRVSKSKLALLYAHQRPGRSGGT